MSHGREERGVVEVFNGPILTNNGFCGIVGHRQGVSNLEGVFLKKIGGDPWGQAAIFFRTRSLCC